MQVQCCWHTDTIDVEVDGKVLILPIRQARELYGRLGMAISHYNDIESMAEQHDLYVGNLGYDEPNGCPNAK